MKIKDIMAKDVVFATPQTKVVEVADMIFKNGFHGLPVVDDGKVVGIITENDFYIKDQGTIFLPSYISFLKETKLVDDLPSEKKKKIKKLLSLEAKDIMTTDPVTVFSDLETEELLDLIRKTRFNTLPVTDENKNLLGVVTLVDVIGMVKQARGESNNFHPKEVEELTRDVHSWWRKSFVFIGKGHIRKWQTIFAIAFIAGAMAATIWMISAKIQQQSGAAPQEAILALRSDDVDVKEGDLFNIDVMMNTGGQDVIAARAVISYDPKDFQLEIWDTDNSVLEAPENCTFEGNPCQVVKNDPQNGEIYISLANPRKKVKTDNGRIANIVFKAIKSVSSDSANIKLSSTSSAIFKSSYTFPLGSNRNNILTSVGGITINVIPANNSNPK